MLCLTTIIYAFLLALCVSHDERLKDVNGNYIERGCATEEHNEELLANDADWRQSLEDFESRWAAKSKEIQSGEANVEYQALTVPVIWHVVMQNPSQVPDSAIAYQLNVLNQDFSASNSDYTSGTPVEFRGVRSGDTGIRYYTNQVLRVVTSVSSFSTNDNIKRSANGGSNVVSPASNLNFWVGVLSGGVLGYAQFPGGSSATDGVVCAPGTLAPSIGSAPYNLGRTGTHEIGHWLNLRHIWGDNTGCTNTQLISDFVIDTPPSSSSNFGCPAGTKRCTANTYSQDMYMNYMDYVYDDCMVMFTQLQNARAQQSISDYRGGFSLAAEANVEYVNWLYFMRFEDAEPDMNEKCVGNDILFYDNNLNEGSNSNIYIYGCLTKTKMMSVSHMTDIEFVYGDNECADGYSRASQDLNEGNDGDSIYMCYNHVESTEENENVAILDITFVKDDDTSKLNENEWIVNKEFNVNPSGNKLNIAVKTGEYFTPSAHIEYSGNGNNNENGLTQSNQIYIGVGVTLVLLLGVIVSFMLWKRVFASKGFKEAMNESLANEYGATTEMTKVDI